MAKTPAWQRAEGKNPEGGLNEKGRASLRAAGHDIKRPQPEGGSRKDSFCARMKGMKSKLTSSETANDPDSRINKSLRKWKCADGGPVDPYDNVQRATRADGGSVKQKTPYEALQDLNQHAFDRNPSEPGHRITPNEYRRGNLGGGEYVLAKGGSVRKGYADGGAPDAVTQAYRDYLGYDPDPGGLKYWQQQIAGGMDPQQLINTLAETQESQNYLTNQAVGDLYKSAYGRAPTAGELAQTSQQLSQGANIADIQSSLAGSKEGQGYAANQAVNQAYQSYLGYNPDPEGARYWSNMIASGQMTPKQFDDYLKNTEAAQMYAASNFQPYQVAGMGAVPYPKELPKTDVTKRQYIADQLKGMSPAQQLAVLSYAEGAGIKPNREQNLAAIMWSAQNRAGSGFQESQPDYYKTHSAKSLYDQMLAPYAYSSLTAGGSDLDVGLRALDIIKNKPEEAKEYIDLASKVASGQYADPTKGATLYATPTTAGARRLLSALKSKKDQYDPAGSFQGPHQFFRSKAFTQAALANAPVYQQPVVASSPATNTQAIPASYVPNQGNNIGQTLAAQGAGQAGVGAPVVQTPVAPAVNFPVSSSPTPTYYQPSYDYGNTYQSPITGIPSSGMPTWDTGVGSGGGFGGSSGGMGGSSIGYGGSPSVGSGGFGVAFAPGFADGGAVDPYDDVQRAAKGGAIWDKPRPKKLGKSEPLSPKEKSSAKAAAKAAGRPYPNLIDNMRAARADGGPVDDSSHEFVQEQLKSGEPQVSQYVAENDFPARAARGIEAVDTAASRVNNLLANVAGQPAMRSPEGRTASEVVQSAMPVDPYQAVQQAARQWDEGDRLGAAETMAAGMPMLGIIPVDVAKSIGKPSLPKSDVFERSISSHPGARIEEGSLVLPIIRGQQPEQHMMPSVRGGVFYLPQGDKNFRYYNGSWDYGGPRKISGETAYNNPLFVKGGTGGKAPEAAYSALLGKDAMKKLESDVGSVAREQWWMEKQDKDLYRERVANFLEEHGIAPAQADYIIRNSRKGNQLRYALQENIIGNEARKAGYDSIIGYGLRRDTKKTPFMSEIFDLRESHYPGAFGDYKLHEQFKKDGGEVEGDVQFAPDDPYAKVQQAAEAKKRKHKRKL